MDDLNDGPQRRAFLKSGLALAGALAVPGTVSAAMQTACILIDFQKSNSGLPLQPFSYDQAIASAGRAASAIRAAGGLVVRTRVLEEELLHPPADKPPTSGTPASDGATLDPRLSQQPGDVVVTKRQWGAFYGTSLDQPGPASPPSRHTTARGRRRRDRGRCGVHRAGGI